MISKFDGWTLKDLFQEFEDDFDVDISVKSTFENTYTVSIFIREAVFDTKMSNELFHSINRCLSFGFKIDHVLNIPRYAMSVFAYKYRPLLQYQLDGDSRPDIKINPTDLKKISSGSDFIIYLIDNNIDPEEIFRIEISFNMDNKAYDPLLIRSMNGEKLTHEEEMRMRRNSVQKKKEDPSIQSRFNLYGPKILESSDHNDGELLDLFQDLSDDMNVDISVDKFNGGIAEVRNIRALKISNIGKFSLEFANQLCEYVNRCLEFKFNFYTCRFGYRMDFVSSHYDRGFFQKQDLEIYNWGKDIFNSGEELMSYLDKNTVKNLKWHHPDSMDHIKSMVLYFYKTGDYS